MDSMMDEGVFCCCFWASLSCVNCVNLLRCRPLATSTDNTEAHAHGAHAHWGAPHERGAHEAVSSITRS